MAFSSIIQRFRPQTIVLDFKHPSVPNSARPNSVVVVIVVFAIVVVVFVVRFFRGLVQARDLISQVVKEDGEEPEHVGDLRNATNPTSATRGTLAYTLTATAMLAVRPLLERLLSRGGCGY